MRGFFSWSSLIASFSQLAMMRAQTTHSSIDLLISRLIVIDIHMSWGRDGSLLNREGDPSSYGATENCILVFRVPMLFSLSPLRCSKGRHDKPILIARQLKICEAINVRLFQHLETALVCWAGGSTSKYCLGDERLVAARERSF